MKRALVKPVKQELSLKNENFVRLVWLEVQRQAGAVDIQIVDQVERPVLTRTEEVWWKIKELADMY